jgi:hypothetical protein
VLKSRSCHTEHIWLPLREIPLARLWPSWRCGPHPIKEVLDESSTVARGAGFFSFREGGNQVVAVVIPSAVGYLRRVSERVLRGKIGLEVVTLRVIFDLIRKGM